MSQTSELANRLWKQRDFFVYETAAHLVFRADTLKAVNNYVVSEFFEDQPAGALVHTMRNENLEQLTFADNTFDILISSDVLEHVGNIEKALSEIKRVVKPGGFHVFTVPVDNELPKTRERARISRGNVEYLLEPVRHSDSLREEGILVFRDFGKDIIDYMSRDGFMCQEVVYEKNGMPITSVFYAKKNVNE
ncbi:MAG: class I SAM-dependent methyltransferase [Nitrospirota bacterium]